MMNAVAFSGLSSLLKPAAAVKTQRPESSEPKTSPLAGPASDLFQKSPKFAGCCG
jgi:hypothetical protein